MAFSIGNTASNSSWAGASSAAATITLSAGSILLVCVHQAHASANETVSSVTSAHLTFAKRSSVAHVNGGSIDTNHQELEIWWAYSAGALTSEVVTVVSSGTPTDGSIALIECKGVTNPSSPWDTNLSIPRSNTASVGSSTASVSGVSTDSSSPIVLLFAGATQTAPSAWSGFTQMTSFGNFGTIFSIQRHYYEAFAAKQTGQTYTAATNTFDWMVIADAFGAVSNPYVPPPPSNNGVGGGIGGGKDNNRGKGAKPGAIRWDPYGAGLISDTWLLARRPRRRRNAVYASPSVYDSSINLAAVAGIGNAVRLDAVGALSLNAVAAAADSATLTIDQRLAFNVVAAAGSAPLVDAAATISLNGVVGAAGSAGSGISESITLDASLDQIAQAAADIQAAAAIDVVVSDAEAADVTISGTVSLGAIAGSQASAGSDFDASISFSATMAAGLVEAIGVDAAIDLATTLAARFRIDPKQPLGDIVTLQGTFDYQVELSGIADAGTGLAGTFDITITLDGRT